MVDKPIIFSAAMVRATLSGRKTQTRRVLKPQPIPALCWNVPHGKYPSAAGWSSIPYAIGDRLWVREAHAWPEAWDRGECEIARIWYPAGEIGRGRIYDEQKPAGFCKTRTSIHMPRWASRLTLIVADVRVTRLQEISEADAMAEGADQIGIMVEPREHLPKSYRSGFEYLWNSLHGPEAWAANPWVVALTFRVIRANIDSPEAAQ